MKLYNKGGRALILPKEDVISGGRFLAEDKQKNRPYFDPQSNVEVSEKCGQKLLGMYPEMLVRMDTPATVVPKKKKAVKKAVPAKAG